MPASQTATTPKLTDVLLVDDNPSTNYLHARVLRNSGRVGSVNTCTTGQAALDYLRRAVGKHPDYPMPDVIFLDINMPGMSGWEFLDGCENLPKLPLSDIDVIMLTSSLNPDDALRAKNHENINFFQEKPLRAADVQRLVKDPNV